MDEENNRRIVYNTLFLYARMLLVMGVSLYTVRIVLNALGAQDYGIYNVVGGIVLMASFLSATLSSASQRFFSYELGTGNFERLNKIFCATLQLYCVLAFIIAVLAETVGLWYLNTQMIIPEERIVAANWIYQFSILSYIIRLLSTPYQTAVISHERMNIYAYVGIVEVVMNLLLASLVSFVSSDKLIMYGFFLLLVTTVTSFSYIIYSRIKFSDTRYQFIKERKLLSEISSYSGWTIFSAVAYIFRTEGINLLINFYFNPVVNAARAVAFQLEHAVALFSSNFFTAVKPQLIKYYAQGRRDEWLPLSFSSSKLCGYLVILFSVPLMVFTEEILELWLKNVPEYTVVFTRLILISSFVDSLTNPLVSVVQATGKVKWYHIILGSLLLLNLPVSWYLLKSGFGPESTMSVYIVLSILALYARLFILHSLVNYPVMLYIRKSFLPTIIVFAMSVILSVAGKYFFGELNSIWLLVYALAFSVSAGCLSIFSIGLTNNERKYIYDILRQTLHSKR